MDPRKKEVYMGIPAVRGEKEESYEENRMADYLKAYQATGRPPQPCPQQPTAPSERIALGLPPLFEPYVETPGAAVTPVASTSTAPTITAPTHSESTITPTVTDIKDVPSVQVFQPSAIRVSETRTMCYHHNIVCQPEYAHFSTEELRWQAYRIGKKTAPEAITANPSLNYVPTTSESSTNGVTRIGAQVAFPTASSDESLQSITSVPAYSMHSFEELRVAYMKLGREVNSDEITRQNPISRLTAL